MASPTNQDFVKQDPIDMHIGPTWDPEKYLDLERRMFKVEPRPIPVPKKRGSRNSEPPKKTAMNRFIAAATKVACKLDSLLRAPFERFSSLYHSKNEVEAVSGKDQPTSMERGKVEIESPKEESDVHYRAQIPSGPNSERSNNDVLATRLRESKSHNMGAVVRKGHVNSLVKLYEEYSPVTSGASPKEGSTHTSVSENTRYGALLQPEQKEPAMNGEGGNSEQEKPSSVRNNGAAMIAGNSESAFSKLKHSQTAKSPSGAGKGRRERSNGFRGVRKLFSPKTRNPQVISV